MKEESQIEKFLPDIKSVKIFHWLDEIELRKLLAVSRLLYFEKDETIINQGDVGKNLYVIIRGAVEVSITNKQQQKLVICTIDPGEIFGEAAIFLASRRTATIVCLNDTTAMEISRPDLIHFFKTHPTAGNKLLMLIVLSLLEKLRHANEDLMLEKQPQVNFGEASELIQEFIRESGSPPDSSQ